MRRLFLFLLACGLAGAATAQPIGLRLGQVQGTVGDTVEVVLSADSLLTGRGVLAYRLAFTFNRNLLEPISVETQGTRSSGASVTARLLDGRVEVAAAAATALSGQGDLLRLRLRLTGAGSSALQFDRPYSYLNEGQPALSFVDGRVEAVGPPSVTVNGSAVMVPGETRNLSASGGTAPYTWRSEHPGVASVEASGGAVTAHAPGRATIVARDAEGFEEQVVVEVRPFELAAASGQEANPGDTVRVPLTLRALGAPGAVAGRIRLAYSAHVMEVLDVETAGTLLDGATVTAGRTPGVLQIAFAAETPVSGDGVLLHLLVRAGAPGYTSLDLQEARFDEQLEGRLSDGTFRSRTVPALTLSPSSATLVAGDSLRFQTHGGTGTIQYTLSDSSLATIDDTGLLRVLRGGTLVVSAKDPAGAVGHSQPLALYDARLRAEAGSVAAGDQGAVVLRLDPLPPGVTFTSARIEVEMPVAQLTVTGVSGPGGMQLAWRQEQNRTILALAGSQPQTGGVMATLLVQAAAETAGRQPTVRIASVMLDEGAPRVLPIHGTVKIEAVRQTPLTPLLAWSPLPNATSYQVQVATAGSFASSGKGTAVVLDTLVMDEQLTLPEGLLAPATAYEWRYRAGDAPDAPWQPARSFETRAVPQAVTLLAPADGAAAGHPVVLTWESVSGATGYDVQVARHSFDTLAVSARITDTSFEADALEAQTSYVWRVRAINAEGEGVWSAASRFTIRTTVGIEEERAGGWSLEAPWPSPARHQVQVRFSAEPGAAYHLKLFDATGRQVATLRAGVATGGAERVVLDASDLPSGLYLLRLEGGGVYTRPLVVVR